MGIKLGRLIEMDDNVTSFDVEGVPLSLHSTLDSKGLLEHYRKLFDAQSDGGESVLDAGGGSDALQIPDAVRGDTK